MTTINLPHKFSPREYQIPFLRALDNGIKRAIIKWHRRSGKDKVCFNYLIRRAVEEKGNYYYFFPTATLARQAMWDNIDNDGFKSINHIPQEIIASKKDAEMQVELINGSTIKLIGSDKFEERAVGTNPRGVIFSEYSITEPQVWNYVSPILKVNGGWAIFNYTPRGNNHAEQLYQRASLQPETWFAQTLTIENTHILTPEDIEEEIKDGMPKEIAEQEYYCKVIDGAGAFFKKVREKLWEGNLQPDSGRFYALGADLAKYQDWTVLTAVDRHNFRVGKQERFNKIDWTMQKMAIENFYNRWNKQMLRMDGTGIGDPIVDDLHARGVSVDSFKFTEQSRMQLLNNLRIMIEQGLLTLPNDEQLLVELESFQYTLTAQGKIKVAVPDGMHDDCVMSLALAVWEIGQPVREPHKNSLQYLLTADRNGDTIINVGSDMD